MKKTYALLCVALLPAVASAAYTPTPEEAAVLEAVLRDEARTFVQGGGTVIATSLGLSAAPAEAVSQAFAALREGQTPPALEKPLMLSGKVASAEAAARRGRWITFASATGPAVRVLLSDGLAASGVSTRAGSSLTVVCRQLDVSARAPSFTGCEAASAVADREVAKLRAAFRDFYQGKPTDVGVSTLAVNVSMSAMLLPADHGCPDDVTRCTKALQASAPPERRAQALKTVVHRFRDAGLDMTPYDKQK